MARVVNTMQMFVDAPVADELLTVPGLGPFSKAALEAAGVTTVAQLIGVFLTLRTVDTSKVAHAAKFHSWLKENGVKHRMNRDVILVAISRKVGEKFICGYCDEEALKEYFESRPPDVATG